MRKVFVGRLNVFREGPMSDYASAEVMLLDGRRAFWQRAPQGFINVLDDQLSPVKIRFTAEEKGMVDTKWVDLANPRGVRRI